MAVPAAVPVEVNMASAKGERVITAREQMRTRLGWPISVMVMRSKRPLQRGKYKGLYVVARSFFLLLFNCSARL